MTLSRPVYGMSDNDTDQTTTSHILQHLGSFEQKVKSLFIELNVSRSQGFNSLEYESQMAEWIFKPENIGFNYDTEVDVQDTSTDCWDQINTKINLITMCVSAFEATFSQVNFLTKKKYIDMMLDIITKSFIKSLKAFVEKVNEIYTSIFVEVDALLSNKKFHDYDTSTALNEVEAAFTSFEVLKELIPSDWMEVILNGKSTNKFVQECFVFIPLYHVNQYRVQAISTIQKIQQEYETKTKYCEASVSSDITDHLLEIVNFMKISARDVSATFNRARQDFINRALHDAHIEGTLDDIKCYIILPTVRKFSVNIQKSNVEAFVDTTVVYQQESQHITKVTKKVIGIINELKPLFDETHKEFIKKYISDFYKEPKTCDQSLILFDMLKYDDVVCISYIRLQSKAYLTLLQLGVNVHKVRYVDKDIDIPPEVMHYYNIINNSDVAYTDYLIDKLYETWLEIVIQNGPY